MRELKFQALEINWPGLARELKLARDGLEPPCYVMLALLKTNTTRWTPVFKKK